MKRRSFFATLLAAPAAFMAARAAAKNYVAVDGVRDLVCGGSGAVGGGGGNTEKPFNPADYQGEHSWVNIPDRT